MVTGLNSLAYSASHAQKDAILSLAKEGEGKGEWQGRSQDAVSTCPPREATWERARVIQNRLRTVLNTGSARQFQHLQTHAKISQSRGLGPSGCLGASESLLRAAGVTPARPPLLFHADKKDCLDAFKGRGG